MFSVIKNIILVTVFLFFLMSGIFSYAEADNLKPQPVVPANYLRQLPSSCDSSYIKEHLNKALPCYIMKPEPTFHWEKVDESYAISIAQKNQNDEKVAVTSYKLNSLSWSPSPDTPSSHPQWQHRVIIYTPEHVTQSTALLFINGGTLYGKNQGACILSEATNDSFATVAAHTHSIVIDLQDVPNQYLLFKGSEQSCKEDWLVADSWKIFLKNPEVYHEAPLQFPMTKSVIQAMSAIQSITSGEHGVKNFILAGLSKRGWAAWLATAMDRRVIAVIPGVIDLLNTQVSLQAVAKIYPEGAPALAPYWPYITDIMSVPMTDLMTLVDPYSYLELLAEPAKYIMTASGDDFFLPDASRYYYDNLPGAKWLNTFPNARHYIEKQFPLDLSDTIEAIYGALLSGDPVPVVDSKIEKDVLRMNVSRQPKSIQLWQADNPESRDFRMTTLAPANQYYQSSLIRNTCASGAECFITVDVPRPEKGWKAWFVQFAFDNAPYPDLTITTPVQVTAAPGDMKELSDRRVH